MTVSPDLIKQATKDCERTDCCISHQGAFASFIHQGGPFYDREGTAVAAPQNNAVSHSFSCSTCGKSMMVQV